MEREPDGVIEGGTAEERAIELAGLLAERGVGEIALAVVAAESASAERGGWRRLRARETDLPGEIIRALKAGGTVEVYALDRAIRAHGSRDKCVWWEGIEDRG